jgi:class 3 adenylate cyclase
LGFSIVAVVGIGDVCNAAVFRRSDGQMPLKEDLSQEVKEIFRIPWQNRNGYVVPDSNSVQLGKDSVLIDGVVLYADMRGSTALVDGYLPAFAAEVYKAFLHVATKVIKSEGGEITAFDGDRVMAVFIGADKEDHSVRCGLKINYAVVSLVNTAMKERYTSLPADFKIEHVVGVDGSSLFVAKTGIRGSNDLVWVGRSANHAAKLSALREPGKATWITETVFSKLSEALRISNGSQIWEKWTWNGMNRNIYCSTWNWSL